MCISGSGASNGIILQRFPEKNWDDTPFIEGIEWVLFLFGLIHIYTCWMNILFYYFCSFVNLKAGRYLEVDKNLDFSLPFSLTWMLTAITVPVYVSMKQSTLHPRNRPMKYVLL